MASSRITRCIGGYTVGVVQEKIQRHEAIVSPDFIEICDTDTSEVWQFLAEPSARVEIILRLAQGLSDEQRREIAAKLTPIEIASAIPRGPQ